MKITTAVIALIIAALPALAQDKPVTAQEVADNLRAKEVRELSAMLADQQIGMAVERARIEHKPLGLTLNETADRLRAEVGQAAVQLEALKKQQPAAEQPKPAQSPAHSAPAH